LIFVKIFVIFVIFVKKYNHLIGVSKTTHTGNDTENVVVNGENVKFACGGAGVVNIKDGVIYT
tara:strand:+ start:207 stop:395 length:189 start_codon:yes stop_codon:yes gene_type:complete